MEKYVSIPVSKEMAKDKEYLSKVKAMLMQQALNDEDAFIYANRGEYIEVIHRYSIDPISVKLLEL